MYLTIPFVLLILFGVVRADSDSGLGLLGRHSAYSSTSRHTVIAKPPSRIVRDSHPLGGHLEVRGDGCPSGYDPCGGDTCCPPGCIPCDDNTNTCCEVGTFCTTNHSMPVCGCYTFGNSCPGGNPGPPTTSSTQHTISKSTFGVTVSGTATVNTFTTSSVGLNSTTTSLSTSTSSTTALPSTTTNAGGSSSGNAGGGTSAATAIDFNPPLLLVLRMGIVTLLIEQGIRFLG